MILNNSLQRLIGDQGLDVSQLDRLSPRRNTPSDCYKVDRIRSLKYPCPWSRGLIFDRLDVP